MKDTSTPSLLVGGGLIFLVLAIAGSIRGQVAVPPQHQRIAGAIGVALLLAPALLQPDIALAPTLPPAADAPPPTSEAPATSTPPATQTTPAPTNRAAVEPTSVPTTAPAPVRGPPEASLRAYWQAVSEQRYADA